MSIVEYCSDHEKSDFVLGWRYFFKYKVSLDFQIDDIIANPMFSDLLFAKIQNIEKCYTKEEINNLKKFRFELEKNKVYSNILINLSYLELMNKLIEYSREESWGNDLQYYLESIKFVKDKLSKFKADSLYCIILENEDHKNFLSDPRIYSYYVSILALSNVDNELIVIDLGGD